MQTLRNMFTSVVNPNVLKKNMKYLISQSPWNIILTLLRRFINQNFSGLTYFKSYDL